MLFVFSVSVLLCCFVWCVSLDLSCDERRDDVEDVVRISFLLTNDLCCVAMVCDQTINNQRRQKQQ